MTREGFQQEAPPLLPPPPPPTWPSATPLGSHPGGHTPSAAALAVDMAGKHSRAFSLRLTLVSLLLSPSWSARRSEGLKGPSLMKTSKKWRRYQESCCSCLKPSSVTLPGHSHTTAGLRRVGAGGGSGVSRMDAHLALGGRGRGRGRGCPGTPSPASGAPGVVKAHTPPLSAEGGCHQQGRDGSAGQNHRVPAAQPR